MQSRKEERKRTRRQKRGKMVIKEDTKVEKRKSLRKHKRKEMTGMNEGNVKKKGKKTGH